MLTKDEMVALATQPCDTMTVIVRMQNSPIRSVLVRRVTGKEGDIIGGKIKEWVADDSSKGRLASYFLANDDGSRMFGDDDAEVLNSLPNAFIEPIVQKAMAFNALGGEGISEALEKNSETTQGD